MSKPVKFTGIYDTSSDGRIMSIHILGSGVCYNIRSPFKWAAVDRCRKSIVHDQRNTMSMCCVCKPLDVKYDQCRVGDCLSEYGFRIWLKSRFQLFVRTVRIYECKINSHTFHRYGKQVICSAIYRRGRYDMIACAADVKYRIKGSRLPGRSQHRCRTTFQRADFRCYLIIGRILQTCIKISALFQIKQTPHRFTGIIFKCCTLNDRNHS